MENMAFLFLLLAFKALVYSVDSTPILLNITLASGRYTQSIQSLNYPSNYTNDLDYTWNVSAPDDYLVGVIFIDFELEEGYDFLSVEYNHQESSEEGILLVNLTGSTLPTYLLSPVNNLWIRFTSDHSVTAPGFAIKVKAIPQSDATSTESTAITLESSTNVFQSTSASATLPNLSASHSTLSGSTTSYVSEDHTLATTMETVSTESVPTVKEILEQSTGPALENTTPSSSEFAVSTNTVDLTTLETTVASTQLMDDVHTSESLELVTTDTIAATSPDVSRDSAHLTSTYAAVQTMRTVTTEDSTQYSTKSEQQTTTSHSPGSSMPLIITTWTSTGTTSLPLQTITEADLNDQSESTLESTMTALTGSTVPLDPYGTQLTTEETITVVTTQAIDDGITSGPSKQGTPETTAAISESSEDSRISDYVTSIDTTFLPKHVTDDNSGSQSTETVLESPITTSTEPIKLLSTTKGAVTDTTFIPTQLMEDGDTMRPATVDTATGSSPASDVPFNLVHLTTIGQSSITTDVAGGDDHEDNIILQSTQSTINTTPLASDPSSELNSSTMKADGSTSFPPSFEESSDPFEGTTYSLFTTTSDELKELFTSDLSTTTESTYMYMQTSDFPTQVLHEDPSLSHEVTPLTSTIISDIFLLTNMKTTSISSEAPDAQTTQESGEATTLMTTTPSEISPGPESPSSPTSVIGTSTQLQTSDAYSTKEMTKSVSITTTSSDTNTSLNSASEATMRSTSHSTTVSKADTTESESLPPSTTHPADSYIKLESGDSQTVQSPNYPSNYDNYLDYSWYIVAPLEFTIYIEFEEFYLETGYDFLIFECDSFDGYSNLTSIANLTGTSYPPALVCPVNNLWIRFTTDYSISKMGFSVVVTAVATTVAPSSAVVTTSLPSPLLSSSDQNVAVAMATSEKTPIPEETSATSTTTDDTQDFEHTMGPMSGEPTTVLLNSSPLQTSYASSDQEMVDSTSQAVSYSASFFTTLQNGHIPTQTSAHNNSVNSTNPIAEVSTPLTDTYGSLQPSLSTAVADSYIKLESGDSKTVQSPNYPSNYDNYLDYSWYIVAPLEHTIHIEFEEFYLETGYDFLTLEYESSDGYNSRTSIANLTGTSYPSALVCPVNNLWIRFTTDYSISKMGFSVVVTAVATTVAPTSAVVTTSLPSPSLSSFDQNVSTAGPIQPSLSTAVTENHIHVTSGDSQTIQSRNYPSNYDNYIDSTWYITGQVNCTIRVDFEYFDLETNYDFLVLEYEPSTGSSSTITLANLTGTSYPSSLESPTNNIWIHFITDYTITRTGFSIDISAVAGNGMLSSDDVTTASTLNTVSYASSENTPPVEETSYISSSTDGVLGSQELIGFTPGDSTTSSDSMTSFNSGSPADMERTTSPEYLLNLHATPNLTHSTLDVGSASDDLAVAITSTPFATKEITSDTTQPTVVALSEELTQTPSHFDSSPSHSFMTLISGFLSTMEPTTTPSQTVDVQTTPLVSRIITPNTATTSLPSQSYSMTTVPSTSFAEQTSETPQTTEEILTTLTSTTQLTSDMLEATIGFTSEAQTSIQSSSSTIITIPVNFQTTVLQTSETLIESTRNIATEEYGTVGQEFFTTEISSSSSQTTPPHIGTLANSEDLIKSTSNVITDRSGTVASVSQEFFTPETSPISSQTAQNTGTPADSEDAIESISNIITERSETVSPVSQEFFTTETSSILSQTTPNIGTPADSAIESTSNIITERFETVAPVSQEFLTTELSHVSSQTTPNVGTPADSEDAIELISNTTTERSETVVPVSQEFFTNEISSSSLQTTKTTTHIWTPTDSEDLIESTSNIITERSGTVAPVSQEFFTPETSSISSQTTPNIGTPADSAIESTSKIITERSETVSPVSQEFFTTDTSSILSQTTSTGGTPADSEDGIELISNIITERSGTVALVSQEFFTTEPSSISSQTTSAGTLEGDETPLSSRVTTTRPTLNTDSAVNDVTSVRTTPLNSMRTSMFKRQYTNRTMMKEYSLSVHYNVTTAVKCGKKCLALPNCDSFALNKQMNKCILGAHTDVVGHIYEEMNSFIYVATMKYS